MICSTILKFIRNQMVIGLNALSLMDASHRVIHLRSSNIICLRLLIYIWMSLRILK